MAEFLREALGVEGRELSEELALNSSELRLSEASLRPLLMELLSSQLQRQSQRQTPLLSPARPATRGISLLRGLLGHKPQLPVAPTVGLWQGASTRWPWLAVAQPSRGLVPHWHMSPSDTSPC